MATPAEIDAALLAFDQLLADVRLIVRVYREVSRGSVRLRQALVYELRRARLDIDRVLRMLS
jgi:hypothetical protein